MVSTHRSRPEEKPYTYITAVNILTLYQYQQTERCYNNRIHTRKCWNGAIPSSVVFHGHVREYTTPRRIGAVFSRHLSSRHEHINAYVMSRMPSLSTRTQTSTTTKRPKGTHDNVHKHTDGRLRGLVTSIYSYARYNPRPSLTARTQRSRISWSAFGSATVVLSSTLRFLRAPWSPVVAFHRGINKKYYRSIIRVWYHIRSTSYC